MIIIKLQYSRNNVCFECRESARSDGNCSRICSKCNKPMIGIGYRYRIPNKNNNKAWEEMERHFKRNNKEKNEFGTIGRKGFVKQKYNRSADKFFEEK